MRNQLNPAQFMKQNPPPRVCLAARETLGIEKGTLEWDRRGILRCVAAMAMALLLLGCGKGTSTTGTFSAEYRASQILLVPVGAAPGTHTLQLVITPASGPAQLVDLALTVLGPGE